jgi:predicted RNase H-like HicB family nuclease
MGRVQLYRAARARRGRRVHCNCPVLPGLVTEGDTLEEARALAQDAIRAYIESLRKDHLPIPSDTLGSIIYQAGYTNNEFLELLK